MHSRGRRIRGTIPTRVRVPCRMRWWCSPATASMAGTARSRGRTLVGQQQNVNAISNGAVGRGEQFIQGVLESLPAIGLKGTGLQGDA